MKGIMSRHHDRIGWNGRNVEKARAKVQAEIDQGRAVCGKCGKPVLPGQAFDAGHVVDLMYGTADRTVQAEHRSCNRSAGGRLGAAVTNGRRKQKQTRDRRLPNV